MFPVHALKLRKLEQEKVINATANPNSLSWAEKKEREHSKLFNLPGCFFLSFFRLYRFDIYTLTVLLLLETADLFDIDGDKLRVAFLLVGGELLILAGLEANGRLAESDHEDTTAAAAALVILLIRERNVDFRNVVGRVRRRGRVLEHGLSILEDNDAGPGGAGPSRDGKTSVITGTLLVVVVLRKSLAHPGGLLLDPLEEQENGD